MFTSPGDFLTTLNSLGSLALLETFHKPQVDQSFRQNAPCMGLSLNLSIRVGVERNAPGDGVQQTRVDMATLAENYADQRKYPQAEESLTNS